MPGNGPFVLLPLCIQSLFGLAHKLPGKMWKWQVCDNVIMKTHKLFEQSWERVPVVCATQRWNIWDKLEDWRGCDRTKIQEISAYLLFSAEVRCSCSKPVLSTEQDLWKNPDQDSFSELSRTCGETNKQFFKIELCTFPTSPTPTCEWYILTELSHNNKKNYNVKMITTPPGKTGC